MNTIIARDRFPITIVAALAVAVLIGFAKSYYFSFVFDAPPLTREAHLHGMLATIWIGLHYSQARLIAADRVAMHRRIGIVGACVGALLAAQAASLAIGNAAAGHAPPGRDPLQFLSVSLGTATMFGLFLVGALALRRKREWHKRLMLIATMTLLMPAMGRLDTQLMQPLGLPRRVLAVVVTCAFIAWACANDWRKLGRVHPAYMVGGFVLLVSMPARMWIGTTDAWLPIAQWLVGR
jgi:hypothetical protein